MSLSVADARGVVPAMDTNGRGRLPFQPERDGYASGRSAVSASHAPTVLAIVKAPVRVLNRLEQVRQPRLGHARRQAEKVEHLGVERPVHPVSCHGLGEPGGDLLPLLPGLVRQALLVQACAEVGPSTVW